MEGAAPGSADFYVRSGRMTAPGRFGRLFDDLPRDLGQLVGVGQGLFVHEQVAPAYGITLSTKRRRTVQVRLVEELVEQILTADERPMTVARPVAERLGGHCRQFTVLLVAALRAQHVPARARCGFGDYFVTGMYEDHWVCEYYDADSERWALVDGQLDPTQQRIFAIDFDPLDVPRDRFLIAADAWAACRRGDARPDQFGMSMLNESGSWWIAQNLIRDAAALNKVEMLPWDHWGVMPSVAEQLDDHQVAFFDQLAALTQCPDVTFTELRARYRGDANVRVPQTVRNGVLERDEPVGRQEDL